MKLLSKKQYEIWKIRHGFVIPMVARPRFIEKELITVQSMSAPSSMIFYIDYKYKTNL